ncbi:MAG: OsmC family protein [Ferruginibacter sp.]
MSHKVSTRYNGKMNFGCQIGPHEVKMDVGEADGGQDSAPSPKKLMLASLTGCTAVDIVSILNKMKLGFSEFSVDATATLSEEHPKIYNKVRLSYKIKLAEADRPKMQKAIKLSEEKYCGVMAMFRAFAIVETEVEYL